MAPSPAALPVMACCLVLAVVVRTLHLSRLRLLDVRGLGGR